MRRLLVLSFLGAITAANSAWGASVYVTMRQVDKNGVGDILGVIEFLDTAKGLKILPDLGGLTEGQHGMHVHENASCRPMEQDGQVVPGLAAGGHFDPANTGRHEGPMGQGHRGDLPVLYVDAKGDATRSSWARRLTTADLAGRAIVIHAGGDNYSDTPRKLGGGARGSPAAWSQARRGPPGDPRTLSAARERTRCSSWPRSLQWCSSPSWATRPSWRRSCSRATAS